MEEPSPYSLHICRDIVQRTLLSRMAALRLPSPQQLKQYSKQHSECLSDALLMTSQYAHDRPSSSLAEDCLVESSSKKPLRLLNLGGKVESKRNSLKKCLSKDSKGSGYFTCGSDDIAGLKLVPLAPVEDESEGEGEEEEWQNRMREMKVHQQFVRTLYAQNQRQNNRKMFTIHKSDNKTAPKVPVYDFNGSLVAPLKNEAVRLPSHFQELEVQVRAQPEETVVRQPKKARRQELKVQPRRSDLRPLESIFLRELTNVEWVEGVQVEAQREECRKILGNQGQARKKKVDLFKPSDKPVRIRLDELEAYKTQGKSSDENITEEKGESETPSYNTILVRDSSKSLSNGCETIQVANSRGLQFLMKEEGEGEAKVRKSQFAVKKKVVKVMSFHEIEKGS